MQDDKRNAGGTTLPPEAWEGALADLAGVVAYLREERGMRISSVRRFDDGLEETLVAMDGPLPLTELERRFADQLELRFGPLGVFSAVSYVRVAGPDPTGSQ